MGIFGANSGDVRRARTGIRPTLPTPPGNPPTLRYDSRVRGQSTNRQQERPPERCGFCGHPLTIVWVHGHGQCGVCHINVVPCCNGEQATESAPREQNEVEDSPRDGQT